VSASLKYKRKMKTDNAAAAAEKKSNVKVQDKGPENTENEGAQSPEEHFRKAIELDPRHADGYGRLGTLAKERGDVQEAMRLWRLSYDLGQKTRDIVQDLGMELVRVGDLDAADRLYKERGPDSVHTPAWTLTLTLIPIRKQRG